MNTLNALQELNKINEFVRSLEFYNNQDSIDRQIILTKIKKIENMIKSSSNLGRRKKFTPKKRMTRCFKSGDAEYCVTVE